MPPPSPAADPSHPAGRYSAPARFFHWTTVLLVALAWPAGRLIQASEGIAWLNALLYFIHENLGATIWLLTLARLAWRFINPPPPLPADLPAAMRRAAHATHAALYVILLGQPIAGFITTNAFGFPLEFFGLVQLPNPVGESEALGNAVKLLRWGTALALVLLLAAHLGGAFYHLLVRKDGIFRRMV